MRLEQLQAALCGHGDAAIVTINGVRGYVQSVQREDGSGRSFIVNLLEYGTREPCLRKMYVRVN